MKIVILEDDVNRVAMMLAHCISPETIICASLHMHEGVIVVTLSVCGYSSHFVWSVVIVVTLSALWL